ncbi:TPA: hypothetical protein ACX3LH_006067 [Klebsiella michiganensis]
MTSKLTRERLQEIAEDGFLKHGESKELARIALAAMDSEAVAFIDKQWTLVYFVPPMSMGLKIGDKLYRHAQQPVVDIEPTQMFGIGSIFKPQVVSEQEADCDDCAHYNPKICHGEGCPAISQQSAQPAPVVPDGSDPRDAFEAAFPMPKHVQRCGAGYAVTSYGSWVANDYCVKWEGWIACRAAMLNGGNS